MPKLKLPGQGYGTLEQYQAVLSFYYLNPAMPPRQYTKKFFEVAGNNNLDLDKNSLSTRWRAIQKELKGGTLVRDEDNKSYKPSSAVIEE